MILLKAVRIKGTGRYLVGGHLDKSARSDDYCTVSNAIMNDLTRPLRRCSH